MKYESQVRIAPEGLIEMSLFLVNEEIGGENIRQRISHQVCDLQDQQVRKVLADLGWSTPEQTVKLKNSFMACDLNYIELQKQIVILTGMLNGSNSTNPAAQEPPVVEKIQYCYSTDNEHFKGSFDTLKEAVADCIGDSREPFDFEIGTTQGTKKASYYLDTAGLVENMSERAYDSCGDSAEDFMIQIGKEAIADLKTQLSVIVDVWADKYGLHPTFWEVENARKVTWDQAQAILAGIE